jgi:hypothetical protein
MKPGNRLLKSTVLILAALFLLRDKTEYCIKTSSYRRGFFVEKLR